MELFEYGGSTYQLPSPNGLVFYSNFALYRLAIRSETPKYDHGVLIGSERELVLEFGTAGPEYQWKDEDGEIVDDGMKHYDIRGHYADTLVQGEQKGWTDEERALVEKKALVTQAPDGHQLHSQAPSSKPWPTYDEIAASGVAELAKALGLVGEALSYERENKNRKTVVEALTAVTAPVEELAAS